MKDHLSKGEGLHRKRGISGAHNRDSFMNTLTQHNGKIIREETISRGITRITYEYPKVDGRGNPIGFKQANSPKTVYDPKVYSDKDMLEWGQKAAAKGYYKYTTNKNTKEYSEYFNGIKFRVYVDKNIKTQE
ncbi:CdiA family toxin C-terminal domain-containing protein [Kingella negevensis]|uniref:CdiA family toxin C-terminal domain-containing protein n=1 Tax=Kingella negevensis TaxID=1522312 RepID=UPI002542A595|nr:CdiA family toxin C-terminal domain-containing protein [Kingella negevensis]WII93650.1 CdiA family toxin C-terminal domain-containing protein [Kingella negevensis]